VGDRPITKDMVNSSRTRTSLQKFLEPRPRVYLIDFGLTVKYVNPDGSHMRSSKRPRSGTLKTGTARYASVNVHEGRSHSRRDDLESLCYVFLDLYEGYVN
jgi:hypothetical protein